MARQKCPHRLSYFAEKQSGNNLRRGLGSAHLSDSLNRRAQRATRREGVGILTDEERDANPTQPPRGPLALRLNGLGMATDVAVHQIGEARPLGLAG